MGKIKVERTKDFTTISNIHLRDKNISLKAKGLLTQMLSLPENWDYTIAGLSKINKEGVDSIGSTLRELEKFGYVVRKRVRNEKGQVQGTDYTVYEKPRKNTADKKEKQKKPKWENPVQAEKYDYEPNRENPRQDFPLQENPRQEKPRQENPVQLNTNIIKDLYNKYTNTSSSSISLPSEQQEEEEKLKTVIEILKTDCPVLFKDLDFNFLTTKQKTSICELMLHHNFSLDTFKTLCRQISTSDFLSGGGVNGWKPSLDWLLVPDNVKNVLQGKYYSQKDKPDSTKDFTVKKGTSQNSFNNYTQKIYTDEFLQKAAEAKNKKRVQEYQKLATGVE